MPWLWQLWEQKPYAILATKTVEELRADAWNRRVPGFQQAIVGYTTIVKEEIEEMMDAALKAYDKNASEAEHDARPPAHTAPFHLPRDRTNWYTLYTLLTRHMRRGELKGLQNRARIWRNCEEAIRRIVEHREAGRFPIVNLEELVRQREDREREAEQT
jgi:hypothetical protein